MCVAAHEVGELDGIAVGVGPCGVDGDFFADGEFVEVFGKGVTADKGGVVVADTAVAGVGLNLLDDEGHVLGGAPLLALVEHEVGLGAHAVGGNEMAALLVDGTEGAGGAVIGVVEAHLIGAHGLVDGEELGGAGIG